MRFKLKHNISITISLQLWRAVQDIKRKTNDHHPKIKVFFFFFFSSFFASENNLEFQKKTRNLTGILNKNIEKYIRKSKYFTLKGAINSGISWLMWQESGKFCYLAFTWKFEICIEKGVKKRKNGISCCETVKKVQNSSNLYNRGRSLFIWNSPMGCSIWIPHTPCGRFKKHLMQGEWEFKVDKLIWHL